MLMFATTDLKSFRYICNGAVFLRLCPAFRLPDSSVSAKDRGEEGVKMRHSVLMLKCIVFYFCVLVLQSGVRGLTK